MENQVFSDGIGQVTIIGGTVRLDFVTYSPTEKDSAGQPAAVFNQRVVMSLEGFMQSVSKVQETALVVSKLVQRAREAQPANLAATSTPSAPTAPDVPPAQMRPFP